MQTVNSWIICELSGRWAAALRVALSRLPGAGFAPRLYEVRSLTEFAALLDNHRNSLGLIEVQKANLSEVLQLLADKHSRQTGQFVALLDYPLSPPYSAPATSHDSRTVIDVLREAGVADVLESPRNLHELLSLGKHFAAVARRSAGYTAESRSVADSALSALPWQNAM